MTQDKREEGRRSERRESVCSSSSSNNSNNSLCKEYLLSARMSPNREAVSAPHSRSCSFGNKPRCRDVEILGARPRTNSMPNPDPIYLSVSCENIGERPAGGLYRVRSFTKTSKGLVNRGDSFKKRSNNSIMSSGSTVTDQNDMALTDRDQRTRTLSVASSHSSSVCSSHATPSYFRLVILGSSGVGKTSILRQFMTSEYMGVIENTGGDESAWERTVSVLLDGEESTMEFTDAFEEEESLENMNFDGYVVVFSLTDRESYNSAINMVHKLRNELFIDRAIIMVANKSDLVRKREVTADEARTVAMQYDCKYIETSAALNHQVDDLLVGSLSQIRLKLNINVQESAPSHSSKKNKDKRNKHRRSLISKIFKKNSRKAKSCDNLFVL